MRIIGRDCTTWTRNELEIILGWHGIVSLPTDSHSTLCHRLHDLIGQLADQLTPTEFQQHMDRVFSNIPGPQRAQGPQGPQRAQGPQGPQRAQRVQRTQRAQGTQGPQRAQGGESAEHTRLIQKYQSLGGAGWAGLDMRSYSSGDFRSLPLDYFETIRIDVFREIVQKLEKLIQTYRNNELDIYIHRFARDINIIDMYRKSISALFPPQTQGTNIEDILGRLGSFYLIFGDEHNYNLILYYALNGPRISDIHYGMGVNIDATFFEEHPDAVSYMVRKFIEQQSNPSIPSIDDYIALMRGPPPPRTPNTEIWRRLIVAQVVMDTHDYELLREIGEWGGGSMEDIVERERREFEEAEAEATVGYGYDGYDEIFIPDDSDDSDDSDEPYEPDESYEPDEPDVHQISILHHLRDYRVPENPLDRRRHKGKCFVESELDISRHIEKLCELFNIPVKRSLKILAKTIQLTRTCSREGGLGKLWLRQIIEQTTEANSYRFKIVGEEGVDQGGVGREVLTIIGQSVTQFYFQKMNDGQYNLKKRSQPELQVLANLIMTALQIHTSIDIPITYSLFATINMNDQYTIADIPLTVLLTFLKQDRPNDLTLILKVLEQPDKLLKHYPTMTPSRIGSGSEEINLLPSQEIITRQNRREWANRLTRYLLFGPEEESYSTLGHCFPFSYVNWFATVSQLRVPRLINRQDFKSRIQIEGSSRQTQEWFENLIDESPDDFLKDLLMFWTGSPHIPESSQIVYKVNLHQGDSRLLPVAHTCTYTLDIPRYEHYEQFKERFTRALEEGSGFLLF